MPVKAVVWVREFECDFKAIRDTATRERLKKRIEKIINSPDSGKPLRYHLKGEREVYVPPFRLIYSVEGETLYLLRFEHRKRCISHSGHKSIKAAR